MRKILFNRLSLLVLLFVFSFSTEMISQCAITDLVVTNSDCDDTDKFSIEINFDFTGTGMNGFQVLGNGNNYGTFQYEDLPLTIDGLIGNCDVELDFIVRDVIDPTCSAFVEYGTVCCDDICSISITDFETTECDGLSYAINLNLEYDFVGDSGYNIDINGANYGDYSYEDLPLNIDGLTSAEGELNIITICDIDIPECCTQFSFLDPCVCSFTNIISTIVECDESDTTYYTLINFDHVATNDSFQMGYSNGGTNIFLGTFAYANLPVLAGPIMLSTNEQEILIVDTDDFFCFNSAYLGIVDDCTIECQLFNVFAEASMCEEGEYFMDVEFEGKDLQGSNFEIIVDGTSYGTFEYGENFYTIGPIPSNCDLAPTVVVQDSGVEACSDFYNFSEPICCQAGCNFTSFEVSTVCGLDIITLNGTFENNGAMLSFYFVQFMGTSYGPFLYGDFTFSIQVPLLPNGEYEIIINDSNDPDCQISTTFDAQCDEEPCIIFEVFAEALECNGEVFFVDLEFEYAGEVSDSFEVTGNGMNYGTFAYGNQFYTLGPLTGDCETIYEFFVSDQILEGCNAFFEFEEPICCSNECSISDIEIIEFECKDQLNILSLTLNFTYEDTNSAMFNASIDGLLLGTFNYSDLPVTIEVETGSNFSLQINDFENNDCGSFEEFELDCSLTGCSITEVETEFIECSDDKTTYFVSLNFLHENTSSTFNLLIDGVLVGPFSYEDLPVTLGAFDIDTEYNILIIDGEAESCANEFQLFLEQCETSLDEVAFDNVEVLQLNNSIQINNKESESLKVQLFTPTGALVYKMNVDHNSSYIIEKSSLPEGLYLLNMSNKQGQKTIKLITY
jgi:hypothetical protein